MDSAHYYEVKVDWKNGRIGTMVSPVLDQHIDVATPPEFPGGIPGIWSPEHLLVAAVNSCLMTTFLAIAENSKLSYVAFSSNAKGKLERIEGKYLITEIELFQKVVIEDLSAKDRMMRVLEKSEAACLISNSVKSKIIMHAEVIAG